MTRTTILFYTHEELRLLGLTDDQLKDAGFFKTSFDTIGKAYKKIEYVKVDTNGNNAGTYTYDHDPRADRDRSDDGGIALYKLQAGQDSCKDL